MILIDGFPVDLAVSEEHAFDADVTDDPVEVGSDVTQNMRLKPAVVTLEGVVSDTPLGDVSTDATRLGSTQPSDDAFAILKAIQEAREPVSITTALRNYESMELQSLSVPKSAATGKALRFKAVFKAVRFVTNKRTSVKTPRSRVKVKRGMKPTFDPKTIKSPIGVERDSSTLDKLVHWVGG